MGDGNVEARAKAGGVEAWVKVEEERVDGKGEGVEYYWDNVGDIIILLLLMARVTVEEDEGQLKAWVTVEEERQG